MAPFTAMAPGEDCAIAKIVNKFFLKERHDDITAAERKCGKIQCGKEQLPENLPPAVLFICELIRQLLLRVLSGRCILCI